MNPVRILLAAGFLALAMIGAALLFTNAGREQPEFATLLPAPVELPAFSLTDHRGNAFDRQSLNGEWQLLFFGFTHCPDICPATLQQLAIARNELTDAGRDFPEIVFVSVDPGRDDTATIASYVAHFGAGVRGVTGDIAEIGKLTRSMGIYFEKAGDTDGNYAINHSTAVLAIDRDGNWRAVFGAPHRVEHFVADIPRLTGT